MLHIIYDPINGLCLPDSKVENYVNKTVRNYIKNKKYDSYKKVWIGSEVILNCFCLHMMRDEIPAGDFEFTYLRKDKMIDMPLDKKRGLLGNWGEDDNIALYRRTLRKIIDESYAYITKHS